MILCWTLITICHAFSILTLTIIYWVLHVNITIIKLFVLFLGTVHGLEDPFEDLVIWLSSYIGAIIYLVMMSWCVIIVRIDTIISSYNRAFFFFISSYDSWRSVVCLTSWMVLANRHVIIFDWWLHGELFYIMVGLMSHEVVVVLCEM